MTEILPAPLTPPDCDLRNFPYMPLDVVRLRDSHLAAVLDGEVFRGAVLSWCVSWHQIPAASLPDDDAVLAHILGYGRDVKGWKKLREQGVLHGWVKCSDGRLYHPVVAEKANEAWAGKCKASAKGKAGAAKRWASKPNGTSDATANISDASGINTVKPGHVENTVLHVRNYSKGEEKRGTERKEPPPNPPPRGEMARAGPMGANHATAKVCAALGVKLGEDPKRLNWPGQIGAMLAAGLDLDRDILPAAKYARDRGVANLEWVRKRAVSQREASASIDDIDSETERIAVDENFEDVDADGWRKRVQIAKRLAVREQGKPEQFWGTAWGPPPGTPGCRVPPDILTSEGWPRPNGQSHD